MQYSPQRKTPKNEADKGEHASTVSSLRTLLYPRSVAVIGASRYPGTIGQLLFQCMLQAGFTGTVYPVNPNADSVMSVKAYPTIADVPDEVDVALIAVPAPLVSGVADDCGKKGVKCLVVVSDGFKERGPEGAAREADLRAIAARYRMRVVGPNCMGVINTDPAIRMNATFSQVYPPRGHVAFLSQSGAIGLTIIEYAKNLNLGISTFVSVGNRVDISSNDLLEYWEDDPDAKVILLYLESVGNPHKFARIARRITPKKPIVVVKGGSTQAGSRAAASHTGAMATSAVTADVLFRHAGIIKVNIMEELFDVATFLSNQPLPRGRRLAVVTNGGGPGIIAADAAMTHGLSLPQPSVELSAKINAAVKRDIAVGNPIDTTAGATAEEYCCVLQALAEDEDSDAVLAIFVPPVASDVQTMENAIRNVTPLYWRQKKPLLACFLGERGSKAQLGSNGRFVPCYPFPEEAILALAKSIEYAETRVKPKGRTPRLRGLQKERAAVTVEAALARTVQRPLWLGPTDIQTLLECYAIRSVETAIARTPDEAADAAAGMGFPVAVKLASTAITHKSDVGGVALDLTSEGDVLKAFRDIRRRLTEMGREKDMEGVVIQHMVKGGVETIAGVTQDPSFGPLILFGSGGIYAELIKDVTLRLHPLTDLDAREMIHSIKMAKLFEGYRGTPPSDTASVEDLLLRLSAMVEDLPEIEELDFNPVKVMPAGEGYWVIDARVLVR